MFRSLRAAATTKMHNYDTAFVVGGLTFCDQITNKSNEGIGESQMEIGKWAAGHGGYKTDFRETSNEIQTCKSVLNRRMSNREL